MRVGRRWRVTPTLCSPDCLLNARRRRHSLKSESQQQHKIRGLRARKRGLGCVHSVRGLAGARWCRACCALAWTKRSMIGRAKKRKDRAEPKMRIAKPKDWGPCACSQQRMPGRLREALLRCGCTHTSRPTRRDPHVEIANIVMPNTQVSETAGCSWRACTQDRR